MRHLIALLLTTSSAIAAPGGQLTTNGPAHIVVHRHQTVAATAPHDPRQMPAGIRLVATGPYGAVIRNDGVVESSYGRAIWATESGRSSDGLVVRNSGYAYGSGPICPAYATGAHGMTGCSGIRAEVTKKSNPASVMVDNSGLIEATSAAVNTIAKGIGTATAKNSGTIYGYEFGIEASSKGRAVVMNSGAIATQGDGILATGRLSDRIFNSGTISVAGNPQTRQNPKDGGVLAAISATGNRVNVENTGSLCVTGGVGVLINSSKRARVFNSGLIDAPQTAIMFRASNQTLRVVNDGTIHGVITIQGKNDHLIFSGARAPVILRSGDTVTYRRH